MKDAEKSIAGNQESYTIFKSKLERLPEKVVVIGSHTHTDNRREKVMTVKVLELIMTGNLQAILWCPDSISFLISG